MKPGSDVCQEPWQGERTGGGSEVILRAEDPPGPENIRMLPVAWPTTGHEPEVQDAADSNWMLLENVDKWSHLFVVLLVCEFSNRGIVTWYHIHR